MRLKRHRTGKNWWVKDNLLIFQFLFLLFFFSFFQIFCWIFENFPHFPQYKQMSRFSFFFFLFFFVSKLSYCSRISCKQLGYIGLRDVEPWERYSKNLFLGTDFTILFVDRVPHSFFNTFSLFHLSRVALDFFKICNYDMQDVDDVGAKETIRQVLIRVNPQLR